MIDFIKCVIRALKRNRDKKARLKITKQIKGEKHLDLYDIYSIDEVIDKEFENSLEKIYNSKADKSIFYLQKGNTDCLHYKSVNKYINGYGEVKYVFTCCICGKENKE